MAPLPRGEAINNGGFPKPSRRKGTHIFQMVKEKTKITPQTTKTPFTSNSVSSQNKKIKVLELTGNQDDFAKINK